MFIQKLTEMFFYEYVSNYKYVTKWSKTWRMHVYKMVTEQFLILAFILELTLAEIIKLSLFF